MGVLLPLMVGIPPVLGFVFESGVLDELRAALFLETPGYPVPCTRGKKRVMVGWTAKTTAALEHLLGVKHRRVDVLPADPTSSPTAAPAAAPGEGEEAEGEDRDITA